MNLEITSSSLPDVLEELCAQTLREDVVQSGNEIHVPESMGNGKLSAHQHRNGIEMLSANSIEFRENISVNFSHKHCPSALGFTFIDSGNPVWQLKDLVNYNPYCVKYS